jgi:O-Antigen ligase
MTTVRPSAADYTALRPGRTATRARARTVGVQPTVRIGAAEAACALLLAAAALLGGLSFFSWRDSLFALLALPPLLLALWPRAAAQRLPAAIKLALFFSLLPLLYLIPLPASWLLQLPGRAELLAPAVAELGPQAWLTLALDTDAGWQAWLKILPPLALFTATLLAAAAARRRLLQLLLALALLQALWALLQLAAGSDALYLHGAESAGRASAAFANANHLAGLLLPLLPVFAVCVLREDRGGAHAQQWPRYLAGVSGLAVLACAVLATGSRAGACLLLAEALVLGLWLLHARHASLLWPALALLAAAAVLALPQAGPLLLQGFSLDVADGRAELLRRAFAAAMTFFPLGSGPGSFAGVFASFDTLATLDKVYVNHAHNEPVQLLFELGLAGAALYACALGLVLHALLRSGDARQRACALGVGALLAQSLVDYPLRAPLAGMACAVLLAIALSPASQAGEA